MNAEEIKHIFSLSHVKEEVKRYMTGFKGEARNTKEAYFIFEKYVKREDITDEEKKIFKDQMIDLLKSVGVVVPFQLIPLPFVSTILMMLTEQVANEMDIKILPSSFYKKEEIKEEKEEKVEV